MRNDLMTLKEVCKETGVTRKIVQTYENYGLVKATTKNKYGYLLYDDAAVKKIKKIRLYQRFGYRLSEIAKLEYMTVDEQVMILKEKIIICMIISQKRQNLLRWQNNYWKI